MPNYLKHDNQLIVWHVLSRENEMNPSNIGMPTRYDLTTNQLLEACLDTYQADKEKKYRFFLKRGQGDMDIPLGVTLKEAGIRNGDFIEIVSLTLFNRSPPLLFLLYGNIMGEKGFRVKNDGEEIGT